MKHYSNKLFPILLILITVGISCGKDPASAKKENPPALPEVVTVEPDFSYFTDNDPKLAAAETNTENFYTAKYTVLGMSYFTALAQAYGGYFSGINDEDAEFKDGKWVWEWQYGYGGQYASIKYTGEEKANTFEWNLYMSYSGQGQNVNNYNMLSGSIAKDGKSGSWRFYSLDDTSTGQLAMTTQWSQTSDTKANLEVSFYDDGTQSESYTYNQDGNEFTLLFISDDEGSNIEVYWNTTTQTGYYQQGTDTGTRLCWDDSFNNVTCPSSAS